MCRRLLHASLLALVIATGVRAAPASQLSFDDAFDNGHLAGVMQHDGIYTLLPASWLHFRISGPAGCTPQFRFDGPLGAAHEMIPLVYRYESDTQWRYMNVESAADGTPSLMLGEPYAGETVYFASSFPWSYGQMRDYMRKVEGHRYVRNHGPRGRSALGHSIWGFEVTDPAVPDGLKHRVVVVSRQHQSESLGSHICRGMSDYLIYSEEPEAVHLRCRAIIHFYPMAEPDGVYLGDDHGIANPNRHWLPGATLVGTHSACPETDVLRGAILADTDGSATVGLDLHADIAHSGPYYWWGVKTGRLEENRAAAFFVDRVNHHDAEAHDGDAIVRGTITADALAWPWPQKPPADFWFYDTLGALGFTLEPGPAPPQSLSRIEDVGVATCKALNDLLDPATSVPPHRSFADQGPVRLAR